MSNYTTQLRYIIDSYLTDTNIDVFQKIEQGAPLLFNFNFPIYDENHRLELEKKIITHYYTREIGLETVALFKLKLCEKLNLIMPYFNELYKSNDLNYNILEDINISETYESNDISSLTQSNTGTFSSNSSFTGNEKNTGNESVENEKNNTSTTVNSDFPQASFLTNKDYATGSQENTGSETNTSTLSNSNNLDINNDSNESGNNTLDINSSQNNKNNYTKIITGKNSNRSYSELIKEFRENIINIDSQIIENLEDLFMQIW